ncbi:MAG: TRAP transporter TatT component family protein [Elusimicrobiales bacterium]|nr:TRAP transporter TatT component family protein [Elusimicrobiales bacterium]
MKEPATLKSCLTRGLCLLALSALSACSLNRTAARVTSGVIDKGLPAVFSQADAQYAKEALPANLQLMEILLQSDPGNKALLVNASQGFCGYALMFVEDESPERASGFYSKGEAYAARALKGASSAAAKKSDVPPLFWNTFCKALYINLNRDKPEVLAELPTLEPAIEKLLELDPSFYYNGAQSLMGAYYSLRPRMFGGDPDKAKKHFELALTGAGENFLLNRFLYAKLAAVAAQDPELFEKLLNSVLSAEPREGNARLADEVAKIKAKKLLEKKDELF